MPRTQPKKRVSHSKNLTTRKFQARHLVMVLGLFIIGGFVVRYSEAAGPDTQPPTVETVLTYQDTAEPLNISHSFGSVVYTRAPHTIEISASGAAYCFGTDRDSGTTVTLSSTSLQTLLRTVRTKTADLATDRSAVTASLGDRSLTFNDANTGLPLQISYPVGTAGPDGFQDAINQVEKVCDQKGKNLARRSKPLPRGATIPAAQQQSFLDQWLAPLVQHASAATQNSYTNAVDWYLAAKVNATRQATVKANGLRVPALALQNCLLTTTRGWSTYMADRYVLSHSFFTASVNAAGCGGWTRLAENVGVTGVTPDANTTAQNMLNAYMASQGHKDNILNVNFNRFNTGSAITPDGTRLYNTMQFAYMGFATTK